MTDRKPRKKGAATPRPSESLEKPAVPRAGGRHLPRRGRGRAFGLAAIALVVVAAAAGLWSFRSGRARGDLGGLPSGISPSDLDLVVVTLDTTRADRIGCYGAKDPPTPNLDALAARGVLFENAVSPMPLTLPAHCTLFTSRLPGAHTVRDNGGYKLPAEAVTLAEVLKERGYRTGGFVAAYVLDHKWGIAQGFDRYFDDFDLKAQKSVSMGDIQRRGDEVVAKAFEWLDGVKNDRFFAWIHLYDPHAPYAPPEPYASRFAAHPYNGEIAWTDELVGRIVAGLDRMGVTKRTLVAVLADHGESLGEHGENGHGFFVYEPVTHIPLILAGPYASMGGRRVAEVVKTVDVAPTLLDLMGARGALASAQGRSLVSTILAAGGTPGPGPGTASAASAAASAAAPPDAIADTPVPVPPGWQVGRDRDSGYSETYYARFHFGWSELRAVRTRRWHFIEAPTAELYDLGTDPGEAVNLAASRPDVVADLRKLLGDYERASVPAHGATAPLEEDEETLRKLAALGYAGGRSSHDTDRSFRDLPDPKDRIGIYNLMNRAREAIQGEHDDEAAGLLREVLRGDPEVIDAYFMLGNLQAKKQEWRDAAELYRKTLEKRPDHDYAMIGLADTLVATGRVDDAILGYERFLQQDPGNAQITYRLAQVLLDDGRDGSAAEYFRKTLQAEPKTARAEVGLGVVSFRAKDFAGARASIDRALAIDPKARYARYNLALLAEAAGDAHAAVLAYRAELADYPTEIKARFNLGRLLGKMGDVPGGIAELRRVTEQAPDFATGRFFLAQALLAAGDLAGARAEAEKGLALDDASSIAPLGHYVLADIHSRQGRAREAEAEVRRGKAIEAHPRRERREGRATPDVPP